MGVSPGRPRRSAWLEAYGFGTCGRPGQTAPRNYDRALVTARLQSARQTTAHVEYGRLAPDIGYVYIPSFAGSFGSEFETVLGALTGVQALVIDIRDNGGGNEGNGRDIAAAFTRVTRRYQLTRYRNGPRHDDFTPDLEKRIEPSGGAHFDGPVALITNRYNGSAAEDFVAMMRVIPSAFTVGDTTIGNSSNPLVRELPNGWLLTLPQSMQMTPDGTVIEGRGLAPTFPMMQSASDSTAGLDTLLEFAIAELRRRLQ